MPQSHRLSIVTLGVADLAAARRFYEQGLGFRVSPASVGDIVFLDGGGVVLALYPRPLLAEDARLAHADSTDRRFDGVTLAQCLATREAVDATLARAAKAGATILKPAEDAVWGGYSGYFADLDGHAWEVAWNPHFVLDGDGGVRLP